MTQSLCKILRHPIPLRMSNCQRKGVVLTPASILGLLARLGLQALGSFDGQSVFPLLYVQGLGCFVMGICLRLKEPLGQFYGPLYTALTTGFCGSLTTFSGWQFDIFGAWINAGGYRRGNLSNAVDGIGISLVTLTLSLGSLVFGFNCASLVAQKLTFPKFPSWWQRYAISLLSALMYGAAIVAYFVLPKRYRHQATAALIFSYPGTLTRYLLSILLNPRYPYLPSGTLAANTFGSALLAASHVLQGVNPPVSPNACSILLGLVDGYCGCLTTVSTFAAEIYDLEWWKGCRYVLLSWGLGQLMMVTIFGIPQWSGHVSNHVTCIM
ncbi:hypothetical protein FA15DRAFT_687942 [Coprinopsis marcescibilis]|uniref:CrcB-like protein n=1 Tax=Coprinopsis marcescibilis TaxID=230819 RepID=A0A5C3KS07_COPMA|nr:hypothetical protein FA15DRAFT_687942 [Coprinopsis marcescibilis]